MNLSPIAFLLMVNLLLLVFGMFMDPLPGVMILVPILAPIAHGAGIAADHFAIIVIVNLTFGLMTPPVGSLIFVVASATAHDLGADPRTAALLPRGDGGPADPDLRPGPVDLAAPDQRLRR
ncbi:TRAP transporter large permease subunit [Paracoccus sp. DMF-8]|nr:TRAP transporter large permease subunit [Paracoccus sp. DMF-8]MDF3607626.1 TRAP transporter large permease subunit [Paracoccus sp. DMF-8]